jgi:hypothetical protein
MTVAEAEANKVLHFEEGRADERAQEIGFEGGIVGAARNVGECGDEFGGAVVGGVREEEVGEVIKAAGFEVSSIMDGRGGRH